MSHELTPKEYALWLLARREYAVSQIKTKLKKRFPDESHTQLVTDLMAAGAVDDARFAAVQVRFWRLTTKLSPRFMARKLGQLRVPSEAIDAALEEEYSRDEAIETGARVAQKKWQQIVRKYGDEDAYTKQARLKQYLAGRGFDWGIIAESIAELEDLPE